MANMHVGDIGTDLTVQIREGSRVVDISVYTIRKIKLEKPDETVLERDADYVTNGSDGLMKMTIIANDLDQQGQWKLQGFIGDGISGWHTNQVTFQVDPVVPNDESL